jgi:glycerol kinase
MNLLSLDQSTSATKAVLFSDDGRVLARTARQHRQIYPQPGWVEHDAEEIWRNTVAVLQEMANQAAGLAALSLTNQRETFVVFERASGRPLHHAIVWQCRRGDTICQRLNKDGHTTEVERKTGLKIDTYFSASKIRWLMEERPDIAEKLRSGEAVLGTIDTYLIHRLTGGAVFATDFTNASRTLLFNIETLDWDPDLCALFAVPRHALPEVRESAAHFGTTTLTGTPLPIVGVMGDSQAALFAQRCFQPGTVKATFGTGTSVLLNIGSQRPAVQKGTVTALAWVWRGEPTYALEGLINFSAATLAWLQDQLGLIGPNDDIEKLAQSVADNDGVYLVPAFAGLGAPHWKAEARAALHGLTAHTTRAHVVRAAVESIAYQIHDVLDLMQREASVTLHALHADGGPTCNRFLMQFTADITGKKLMVADVAESSGWGAAMNALLGLGLRGSLDELAALPLERTVFAPQRDPALVNRWHAGWQDAVRRVL